MAARHRSVSVRSTCWYDQPRHHYKYWTMNHCSMQLPPKDTAIINCSSQCFNGDNALCSSAGSDSVWVHIWAVVNVYASGQLLPYRPAAGKSLQFGSCTSNSRQMYLPDCKIVSHVACAPHNRTCDWIPIPCDYPYCEKKNKSLSRPLNQTRDVIIRMLSKKLPSLTQSAYLFVPRLPKLKNKNVESSKRRLFVLHIM